MPRFYGLHRWKPEYGRNVRFVVMNNVFATSMGLDRRFDLKGSTLGRRASAADRAKGPRAILKDMDLLDGCYKMRLGKARKKAFMDQMRSDCHLLMSLKIMDYSLLLGIHYRDDTHTSGPGNPGHPPVSPSIQDGKGFALGECAASACNVSSPATPSGAGGDGGWLQDLHGDDVLGDPGAFNPGGIEGCDESGNPIGQRYFVGIIDILMLYTRRKKLERIWKSTTEGTSGGGCSSQVAVWWYSWGWRGRQRT